MDVPLLTLLSSQIKPVGVEVVGGEQEHALGHVQEGGNVPSTCHVSRETSRGSCHCFTTYVSRETILLEECPIE